jgi:peptide/nickel transport system permease protein
VLSNTKSIFNNKITAYSLFAIVSLTLVSIFSYLIIFDNSPNANSQMLDISLKPMGFKTEILSIPKVNKTDEKQSFFTMLLYGKNETHEKIAFKSIKDEGNELSLILHNGRLKSVNKSEFEAYKSSGLIKSQTFWFGTDKFGRSILSRIILGIRVSIFVGLLAVLVSLTIGIFMGLLGGYFGGWIDTLVMYFINVTWSIPTLLLVFAVVMMMGRGLWVIFLAVGLTMWVDVARIVRGQTLKLKEEQYIMAAKSLGYQWPKILFKHILPNLIGPILVIAAANFATAILVEAGLSFLGFGIKPPAPSLGNILNEHYGYAMSGKYMLAFIPAFIIMILVLCFNLLGSGLRDYFDVKQ